VGGACEKEREKSEVGEGVVGVVVAAVTGRGGPSLFLHHRRARQRARLASPTHTVTGEPRQGLGHQAQGDRPVLRQARPPTRPRGKTGHAASPAAAAAPGLSHASRYCALQPPNPPHTRVDARRGVHSASPAARRRARRALTRRGGRSRKTRRPSRRKKKLSPIKLTRQRPGQGRGPARDRGVVPRPHVELGVVFQQERPLGRVERGRDLRRREHVRVGAGERAGGGTARRGGGLGGRLGGFLGRLFVGDGHEGRGFGFCGVLRRGRRRGRKESRRG
jgi:hypothetical protein